MLAFVAAALPVASGQATPGSVVEIKVAGNVQFSSEAVAAAAGVKPGDPFSREALDAAAQKLFDTGLFRSVNYLYAPAEGRPGSVITWDVKEADPEVAVRIDLPGVDDAAVWKEAAAANSLLVRPLPPGESAAAWCLKALTATLVKRGIREPLVFDTGADLASGQITLFLRLASAPEVTGFDFTGNRVLTVAQLAEAMRPVVGRRFSEYEMHESLEQNVRPLYEAKGFLRVDLQRIGPGAKPGSVAIAIEEGRSWNLREVRFKGEGVDAEALTRAGQFPKGNLADWNEIQTGLHASQQVLESRGYLKAKLTPERIFQQDAGTVDLDVQVERGPLFRFGKLVLEGVPPDLRAGVTALWKIAPGAPMDATYISEFLREAFRVLSGRVAGVSQSMTPADREDVIDVHITFRAAEH